MSTRKLRLELGKICRSFGGEALHTRIPIETTCTIHNEITPDELGNLVELELESLKKYNGTYYVNNIINYDDVYLWVGLHYYGDDKLKLDIDTNVRGISPDKEVPYALSFGGMHGIVCRKYESADGVVGWSCEGVVSLNPDEPIDEYVEELYNKILQVKGVTTYGQSRY